MQNNKMREIVKININKTHAEQHAQRVCTYAYRYPNYIKP